MEKGREGKRRGREGVGDRGEEETYVKPEDAEDGLDGRRKDKDV